MLFERLLVQLNYSSTFPWNLAAVTSVPIAAPDATILRNWQAVSTEWRGARSD